VKICTKQAVAIGKMQTCGRADRQQVKRRSKLRYSTLHLLVKFIIQCYSV